MDFNTLTIRAYNVRFGDAFLISFPDKRSENDPPATATEESEKIMRHILIDVGNSFAGAGGTDEVFEPVVTDILNVLNGRPVDLYIMTHEHMDHIQGLLAAKRKHDLEIKANYSWLTASAEEGYHDPENWKDENAPEKALIPQQQRTLMEAAYDDLFDYANGVQANHGTLSPLLMTMLDINNYRRSKDCVDYLRTLAGEEQTYYIHRESDDLDGKHPFQDAKIEVWAPERNTAVYYGRLRPRTIGFIEENEENETIRKPTNPIPPPGVDASAFYRLVNTRKNNLIENLLAIDKAKNNSSIVFCLEWEGWRFLFPGDAEIKSWRIMEDKGVLKPVHFLKISHHLSHNGTPEDEILEQILPVHPADSRQRLAVASTYPFTYNKIPYVDIVERLGEREIETLIIAEELGDFPTDEDVPVSYIPGYIDFMYKADGSDPKVVVQAI